MRFATLLLALTAAALPRDAPAQAFTFEVPVQLHDLPPAITQAILGCYVMDRVAGGTMIGQGAVVIPLSEGRYVGALLVPVTMTGDPSLARSYNCRLFLNSVEAVTLFNPPDRPGILAYDSQGLFAVSVVGTISP